MADLDLKLQLSFSNHSSNSNKFFTPIPSPIKKKLFYTRLPDYKFDKRVSFLPAFKNTLSDKQKLKAAKLEKCEALQRITLILTKYQKWIRKKKCIVQSWDNDSDSDEDSSDDSDSDSSYDDEQMSDEEHMNLAIFQQMAYGNNSMIQKIKKDQVYNWINKHLSKNYSESRLLEDYLHLLNEHVQEFEQIHKHLCAALDKQIKTDDNFKETYIQYTSKQEASFNVEINIEQLLNEIQLHFGGIFDVTFFHQKYKVLKQIGSGIEGDVHKVKLRTKFDSFIIEDPDAETEAEAKAKADVYDYDEKGQSSSDEEDEEEDENGYYYAAKTIKYNERTMNNYRVMGKFEILDDFEMYLDKKKDKLILVSEYWDSDVFDYMRKYSKVFTETELHKMMSIYILPLLMKLHSNCYIHGDIKASNLVMNIINENENEYGLIDFGTMLKMNELSETARSGLIGSMGYYAPEILFLMYDGPVKIDTKVDIWALGLTFIYLLTGWHPLMNDDLNILGERKIKMKIAKCLNKMQKSNKISRDLCELLSNMLEIKPLKRFNLYQILNDKWITKRKKDNEIESILFLDIDGVLNDKKSKAKTMRPELIMKLKKIINLSQCHIVLSSSWRRVPELKKKFKKQFNKIARINIDSIYIADTPFNGKNPTRVHELMEYFEKNEEKVADDVKWCVVDDMDLINENDAVSNQCKAFLNGHWVQTNIQTGLTNENVQQIISILNND